MSSSSLLWVLAIIILSVHVIGVFADNEQYYYWNGDDDLANQGNDDQYGYSAGGSSWTAYSALPRRCVTYNDHDVVVFSMYEGSSGRCSGQFLDGTYTVSVPAFMSSYLNQLANEAQSNYYQAPDSAQYVNCIALDDDIYAQLGCSTSNKYEVDLKFYSDEYCTVPNDELDKEDVLVDITDLPKIPFKECQACLAYSEDDDAYQYSSNNYMYAQGDGSEAPLCSGISAQKEVCDSSCQKVGHIGFAVANNWTKSDQVLLAVLSLFGIGILIGIVRKRRTMSNKASLLEEAALSSAGLRQGHFVALCFCMIVLIASFASLGIKSVTWMLILILDSAMFVYLMKLVVERGSSTGASAGAIGDSPSSKAGSVYNQWE